MPGMWNRRHQDTGLAAIALALALLAGCSKKADKGTQPGTDSPAGRSNGVAGRWESSWGPITLEHEPIVGGKPVAVTGFWIQGEGKRGVVKSGNFDPATGKLDLLTEEPWINQRGSVQLTLSADGNVLEGSGKNLPSGEPYEWKMVRARSRQ